MTPPHSAQPDVSEERVREHTGRGWQEWVELIDAGPGRDASHAAIAEWADRVHGVGGWWAQCVTVGYERLTGRRLPGQMPDGTFSVSRSKTLTAEPEKVRALLSDESTRADLLAEFTTQQRSAPTAKAPRYSLLSADTGEDRGVLQWRLDSAPSGCRLVITHDKIPSVTAAEQWKEYWGRWLTELAV